MHLGFAALPTVSYRKPANTTIKINATVEKASIFNDTCFNRYNATEKHGSAHRVILVFFLTMKYILLLFIFHLKLNLCEVHDNLSKHGIRHVAADFV